MALYGDWTSWQGTLKTLSLTKKGDNLFRALATGPLSGPGMATPWKSPSLQYKFYPKLVGELIDLNRKWGTPLKKPWAGLKKDLYLDLKWHKRAESIVKESLLHQGLMSSLVLLFTWSFESLNPEAPSLLLPLALIYLGGLFALGIVTEFLEKRALGEGYHFWCTLIRLELFSQVKLPLQEILSRAHLSKALSGKDRDLESVRKVLHQAVDSWQKFGHPLGETLQDLREEYTFIVEQKMDLLVKRLKLVQMGAAFTFILPSFFYLVSVHVGHYLLY